MKIFTGDSKTSIIFDYLCIAFTNVGVTYWKRLASFQGVNLDNSLAYLE